jgi:flagellar biosynthesis protein FlhB
VSQPTAMPRRARLYVTRVDPWSVTKSAFLLSLTVAVVLVVAVALLWVVFYVTGVFGTLSRTLDEVIGSGSASFNLMGLIGFTQVVGLAILIAAVEVVLVTILAALFAAMYNASVGLTGGVEVVLSDDV